MSTTDLVEVVHADVLMPVHVDQAKQAMRAYQEVVGAILEPTDWQGAPNQGGSFVKKSGFRKIAKAYGLSVELVHQAVERGEDGEPIRAETTYRAIAANGQHMDGVGYCSITEPRFRKDSGRQKLENDLRATAATRAANRAISDLVAFGQVSAEEVDGGADHGPQPTFGPTASETLYDEAVAAIEGVVPNIDGQEFVRMLAGTFDNGLPEVAARTLKGLAWWLESGHTASAATTDS